MSRRLRRCAVVVVLALFPAVAVPAGASAALELRTSSTYVGAPYSVAISVRLDAPGRVQLHQARPDRRADHGGLSPQQNAICLRGALIDVPGYIETDYPFAVIDVTEPNVWTTIRVPASRLEFGNIRSDNLFAALLAGLTNSKLSGCWDPPTTFNRILAIVPGRDSPVPSAHGRLQRVW